MEPEDLKKRTKQFSLRVIWLVGALPTGKISLVVGNQLLRSGSSVSANYRAAWRGRSKADFISKMGIAIEEADESIYWMELLVDAGIVCQGRLEPLLKDGNELVAILTASVKTARNSLPGKG